MLGTVRCSSPIYPPPHTPSLALCVFWIVVQLDWWYGHVCGISLHAHIMIYHCRDAQWHGRWLLCLEKMTCSAGNFDKIIFMLVCLVFWFLIGIAVLTAFFSEWWHSLGVEHPQSRIKWSVLTNSPYVWASCQKGWVNCWHKARHLGGGGRWQNAGKTTSNQGWLPPLHNTLDNRNPWTLLSEGILQKVVSSCCYQTH